MDGVSALLFSLSPRERAGVRAPESPPLRIHFAA